jgi:hypothetical protein
MSIFLSVVLLSLEREDSFSGSVELKGRRILSAQPSPTIDLVQSRYWAKRWKEKAGAINIDQSTSASSAF